MAKRITLQDERVKISLDKLDADPANVRKTMSDAGIAALADSIAAHDLLNPLTVRPAETEGRYLVVAGSRRRAALLLLVSQGRLTKTAAISCKVLSAAVDPTSASLAENYSREATHPVDEFEAFAVLAAQDGMTAEQIAVRHGTTARIVRQRVRLGRVAVEILAAYREGIVRSDEVEAFGITDDQDAQRRVFETLQFPSGSWSNHTHTIRAMLTDGEVSIRDSRARFVGIEAYEAAGGQVRRDLFADEASGAGVWLQDAALVARLAAEKINAVAGWMRLQGWANVEVRDAPLDWEERRPYRTAEPTSRRSLTDAETARVAELEATVERLEAAGEVDGLSDEQDIEYAEAEAELERIEEGRAEFSAEDKAAAIVVVSFAGGDSSVQVLLPRDAAATTTLPPSSPKGKSAARAVPETVERELQAHRTLSLQAHVAERPGLALRLLAQALLLRDAVYYGRSPCGITAGAPETLGVDTREAREASPAHAELADHDERRNDHQPGEAAAVLPWLLSMDDGEVIGLLAPLIAKTIDAGREDWTQADSLSLAAQLARFASYDPRRHWQATADTYFGRVSKAQIEATLRAEGRPLPPKEAKKAAVASHAERELAAAGWLPPMLRPPAAVDDAYEPTEDHETV